MAMQDFSRSLPMMLYRTLDAVMPRFRQIFSEFGLTEQQWRVLRVLWEQGPTTARELAHLTLIPAPSLVGIVDRLTISGLVSRIRSNQDRRNVFIETTDAGKELEEKVRPRVDKAYDELRLSFDENHWDELIAGLDRLSGDKGNTRENKNSKKQ
jgi:homoprotocatechuate degradation regulator HpaR